MHESIRRRNVGSLVYYSCTQLPVRHAFTTKFGGVSSGSCESLNLGFNRGDLHENVLRNYKILADAIDVPVKRMTLTHQIHEDEVSVVTEETVGMGLTRPMDWRSDAIVTNLPDTPLAGFYADCVVSLLYDAKSHCCGVCHSGWRGTAKGIIQKMVQVMHEQFGAEPEDMTVVIGPSIGQCCFETDVDVPEEMERQMGSAVTPFIEARGSKFHIDLQGINTMLLEQSGLQRENIINSGICTYCHSDEFWSHRVTHGHRGVQTGVICL